MPTWAIKFFCASNGRQEFLRDYDRQSAAARAEFRATINGLRDQPDITGWARFNGFDRLSGKYRCLGKLRFKADRVQHRPLGFFGPGLRTYTLLIWATERDGEYDPPGVRDTALRRVAMVETNPRLANDCDF